MSTIRYHVTVGASTTAGGKVMSANAFRSINGARLAYAGDSVSCPKCNSTGVIEPDGPRVSDVFNGRQVALSDDICRCKCNPPPRLIANQTFSSQTVDADWHAAKAGKVAESAAQLNTAGDSAAVAPHAVPLVLLDPKTEEPYRNRRYKLEFKDKAVEGTTDQDGLTKPLTATERAAIVRWHVEDEAAPA